jgi:uncharacterized BrkB/YihY/UPF0761 family membrane protein
MRGITTFIVLVGLFSISLIIAVPTLDTIVPIVTDITPGSDPTINKIHAVIVKWSVPVFLFTVLGWAVFWILREERQEVRR